MPVIKNNGSSLKEIFRSSSNSYIHGDKAQIIMVMSPKGGVGKS